MRLRILHRTTYRYDQPVGFGLQQLRLTPKSRIGQSVLTWRTDIFGGNRELDYEDQHANQVMLVSFSTETPTQVQSQTGSMWQSQQQQQSQSEDGHVLSITSEGEVETADLSGVLGKHAGFAPLWYFGHSTALTRVGPQIRSLAKGLKPSDGDALATCHTLMGRLREALTFQTGATDITTTAEEAMTTGAGVCQDFSHAFIAAARHLGMPARYVSGYLHMPDRVAQEASHGWAEVHVPTLGWVGFDTTNGVSPDERYVRVATGLDYSEAAPVIGLRDATGQGETLSVELEVQEL